MFMVVNLDIPTTLKYCTSYPLCEILIPGYHDTNFTIRSFQP